MLSATEILETQLHHYFNALKFFRFLSANFTRGAIDLETPIRWWKQARQGWASICRKIQNNPSITLSPQDSQQGTATITSDASIKGWGAVLVVDGVMRATGKRWGFITDHRRINTLELAAVWLALKNFESLIKDRQITVLSDNVTALSCLRKRRSADFERATVALFRSEHWMKGSDSNLGGIECISTWNPSTHLWPRKSGGQLRTIHDSILIESGGPSLEEMAESMLDRDRWKQVVRRAEQLRSRELAEHIRAARASRHVAARAACSVLCPSF